MLYRKYRSKKFSDIIGQAHVVRTLEGALLSDNVGHAYMFCGPRGTGKTSMARLLAKAMNCEKRTKTQFEPCNTCFTCNSINGGTSLDLIEIDAASNRGIDEIRNIKESARVASTSSKNKIFIIDEVHMLTPPAFNALLKTLEEPPSHVTFILATTEAHKVLDTILSRVQRFDFKKITENEIIGKLKRIGKEEKVSIQEPALAMVASYASGSMRDAESVLAKLIAYSGNTITDKDVSEALGVVAQEEHAKLLDYILTNKKSEAVTLINEIHDSGISVENFSKQFIRFTRDQLVSGLKSNEQNNHKALIAVLDAFIDAQAKAKYSPIDTLPMELAVMGLNIEEV